MKERESMREAAWSFDELNDEISMRLSAGGILPNFIKLNSKLDAAYFRRYAGLLEARTYLAAYYTLVPDEFERSLYLQRQRC